MLDIERQTRIVELLRRHETLTTAELSAHLYASPATIRRDLGKLEAAGLIRRTHGGAVAVSGPESEIPFSLRESIMDTAKRNIAAKAVSHVKNGDVILLDASSTVLRLVPLLAAYTNLTVVTNGLRTAAELAEHHIRTLVTGGVLLENSLAFVGRSAERFIGDINADVLFFSCRGVSEEAEGAARLTDSSLEEASIRKEMLRRSKKHVFLCDSGKFGQGYAYNICTMEDVDVCISDKAREG